jgi:hypothetical protein
VKNLVIVMTCLAGLVLAQLSNGQAPTAPEPGSEIDEMRAKITALERRLAALENRKPAPVTAAQMPFTIRDDQGRTRLHLGYSNGADDVFLTLIDSNGKNRVSMLATDDSGSIDVTDEKRISVARLAGGDDGGLLFVKDPDGRRVDLEGALGVRVRGKDGNSHVQLSTDGKIGQVNVYDSKTGYSVVQLRAISTGAGRLTISNPDGSYLLDAGAATDGAGILKMGPDGYGAAESMASMGRPASVLMGKKGN